MLEDNDYEQENLINILQMLQRDIELKLFVGNHNYWFYNKEVFWRALLKFKRIIIRNSENFEMTIDYRPIDLDSCIFNEYLDVTINNCEREVKVDNIKWYFINKVKVSDVNCYENDHIVKLHDNYNNSEGQNSYEYSDVSQSINESSSENQHSDESSYENPAIINYYSDNSENSDGDYYDIKYIRCEYMCNSSYFY